MNLQSIAAAAVGAVNPSVLVTIQSSSGYTTADDGKRAPTYTTSTGYAQIQPLQYNDLVQLDGLNIQGVKQKIYVSGHLHGVIRAFNAGGDIVILPDGTKWLVSLVLEAWPTWTTAAITLQSG